LRAPRTILAAAVLAALSAQPQAHAQGTEDAFVTKIPGQSMTASVTLSPSDSSGTPGQTLDVPVNLIAQGTAAPATLQTDLAFDQQKLSFTSARAGQQLITANKNLSATVLSNGDIRLVATGLNQSVIANGLVAYATFTLSPQFLSGNTALTLKNCATSTALGGAISTGCTAAVIRPFTCDVNADGATNVLDVQILINEAQGVIPPVHDLNHDGVVNVLDVQKATNAALGLGCPY
jgi:glucose/arabinose dehydrogenase